MATSSNNSDLPPVQHHPVKMRDSKNGKVLDENVTLLPGVEKLVQVKRGSTELYHSTDELTNSPRTEIQKTRESTNTIYRIKTQKSSRRSHHSNHARRNSGDEVAYYHPNASQANHINKHDNSLYKPLKINLHSMDEDSDDTRATTCAELKTPLDHNPSDEEIVTPTLRQESDKHLSQSTGRFRKSELFNPKLYKATKQRASTRSREYGTLPHRFNASLTNPIFYSQTDLNQPLTYPHSPSVICKQCQRHTCPTCQQSVDDTYVNSNMNYSTHHEPNKFINSMYSPTYASYATPNAHYSIRSNLSTHRHRASAYSHPSIPLADVPLGPAKYWNKNLNLLKIEYQQPIVDGSEYDSDGVNNTFQTEIEEEESKDSDKYKIGELYNVKASVSRSKAQPYLDKAKLVWITEMGRTMLNKSKGVDLNIVAAQFKNMLDERFGKTWHCIVSAESFGSNIATIPGALVSFQHDHWAFLVWKT